MEPEETCDLNLTESLDPLEQLTRLEFCEYILKLFQGQLIYAVKQLLHKVEFKRTESAIWTKASIAAIRAASGS